MARKHTTCRGYALSRWLLNAVLFLSLLVSSELAQQPQHFQTYHTELALPARGATRGTATYLASYRHTDVKKVDNSFLLNSFFHTRLHYCLLLKTKLTNARLIVPAVSIEVRYLHFQSALSASDADLFHSLRG